MKKIRVSKFSPFGAAKIKYEITITDPDLQDLAPARVLYLLNESWLSLEGRGDAPMKFSVGSVGDVFYVEGRNAREIGTWKITSNEPVNAEYQLEK